MEIERYGMDPRFKMLLRCPVETHESEERMKVLSPRKMGKLKCTKCGVTQTTNYTPHVTFKVKR